jgi:hypothetical protein
MLYTAVCQQQQTGYGAHQAYCKMCTVSVSWGHIGWRVALAIHKTLGLRIKKEYRYTSSPPFGANDLF